MRVNIPLSRRVNITEIDNRIDAVDSFQVEFISNRQIICEARLQMGPVLHELMQHWLEHKDELFSDVFANLGWGDGNNIQV